MVILLAVVVFSAGSAFASVGSHSKQHATPFGTCSGNGCNGLFPSNTNCGNSVKLLQDSPIYDAGTNTQIGTIRFWWSYTCSTNWTQTWAIVPCDQVYHLYVKVHRNAGPDGPTLEEFNDGIYGGCSDTSPMVYAANETAWGWAEIVFTNGYGQLQTSSY